MCIIYSSYIQHLTNKNVRKDTRLKKHHCKWGTAKVGAQSAAVAGLGSCACCSRDARPLSGSEPLARRALRRARARVTRCATQPPSLQPWAPPQGTSTSTHWGGRGEEDRASLARHPLPRRLRTRRRRAAGYPGGNPALELRKRCSPLGSSNVT